MNSHKRKKWNSAANIRVPWSPGSTSDDKFHTDLSHWYPFAFKDFGKCVGKWVRAKHVQTDEHWLRKPIEYNGIRSI